MRNVNRQIKPVTFICQAHNYPIVIGDSLVVSFKQTLALIFESPVVEQTTMPSNDSMTKLGLTGVIFVKLDDFSPRVACVRGFWTGTCSGSTDVSFGVNIRGVAGPLFSSAASGSKTADGDAGVYCGGASEVIGESITKATRDALERLAERISNSPRLRVQKIGMVSAPAPIGAADSPSLPLLRFKRQSFRSRRHRRGAPHKVCSLNSL
jgi:hypothetical protein